MDKMTYCPYCNTLSYFHFRIITTDCYRCPACDLIFRGRKQTYDDILAAYRNDKSSSHSAKHIEVSRITLFSHILDIIEGRKESGNLLDVGSGCGFFLLAAQARGWKAKGIEPSVQAVEFARRQGHLDVFSGSLGEFGGNAKFDVITFINVLDHSALPWLEIEQVRGLLKPGGLIYLRFPNGFLHSHIYSLAYKLGLSKSLSKFLVFHMYSFTSIHIRRLLRDYGFIQITISNSLPSEGDPHNLFPDAIIATYIKKLIYVVARCGETISSGRLFLGTSLEVIASQNDNV
jgi:2-polyprenyl-3-methyl-5-hydroxy-6-metoxy-1,4-benzoquinol methylase